MYGGIVEKPNSSYGAIEQRCTVGKRFDQMWGFIRENQDGTLCAVCSSFGEVKLRLSPCHSASPRQQESRETDSIIDKTGEANGISVLSATAKQASGWEESKNEPMNISLI